MDRLRSLETKRNLLLAAWERNFTFREATVRARDVDHFLDHGQHAKITFYTERNAAPDLLVPTHLWPVGIAGQDMISSSRVNGLSRQSWGRFDNGER